MPRLHDFISSAVAVSLALTATAVHAQTVATSLDELQPLLSEGQPIVVTDDHGQTIHGKVTAFSASSLAIESDGDRRSFGPGPLTARFNDDGVKRGIWFGLAAGAAAGIIAGAGWCNSAGVDCSDSGGAENLFFQPATIPIGILIGALIDRAHRHKELHVDYPRDPGVRDKRWDAGASMGLLVIDVPRESGRYSSLSWGTTALSVPGVAIGRAWTSRISTDVALAFGTREATESYASAQLPADVTAFVNKTERHAVVSAATTYHGVDPLFRASYHLSAGLLVSALKEHRYNDALTHTVRGARYPVSAVDERNTSAVVRPFVGGGYTFLPGPHVFIRPEGRVAFARHGMSHATLGLTVGTRF